MKLVFVFSCMILVSLLLPRSVLSAGFVSDGATFLTLNREGLDTIFQLSYSSGGESEFNGTDLGTFSSVGDSVLLLEGFENITLEDSGTSIFLGRFCYSIYPAGSPSGQFVTNVSTDWVSLGGYKEAHYSTGMNVDLLDGREAGTYAFEVYALADGNFSPALREDNGGMNYIAQFTITDQPLPVPPSATEDGKMILDFTFMTNTIFGEEVFVVGDHPDLGSWNPINGCKLHWTAGNVWTGSIAITANNEVHYKYIVRTNTAVEFCNPDNTTWMPGNDISRIVPALPAAPYFGKSVFYYSGWTNVSLVYQCGADTNWYTAAMNRIDDGRYVGEFLHTLDQVGHAGELLTFLFYSDDGGEDHWDKYPVDQSDYYSTLDALLVQDGAVYNYWPSKTMIASTIQTASINSAYAPIIPSRDIRVYLPRNYDTNTWKSYPVLYMHDGQNDFQPGGAYGCWNAEITADEMINRGMMRETIIVAVDNSSKRMWEYVPPTGDAGEGAGTADQYMDFLIDDVKTYVDANYRTLSDEANTATLGSSLGGLVSIYLGLATNVFGKVGPMSPSFWADTNFVDTVINAGDSSGLRIYMDCGTDEDEVGDPNMWPNMWKVYDLLQVDGYVGNDTFCTRVGCGQQHNEAAWASRLPMAYSFLMDIRDEVNQVAVSDNPPVLRSQLEEGNLMIGFKAIKGASYILQRSENLSGSVWNNIATNSAERLMWQYNTLTDDISSIDNAYYRIISQP